MQKRVGQADLLRYFPKGVYLNLRDRVNVANKKRISKREPEKRKDDGVVRVARRPTYNVSFEKWSLFFMKAGGLARTALTSVDTLNSVETVGRCGKALR